jgi:hypothetical protein
MLSPSVESKSREEVSIQLGPEEKVQPNPGELVQLQNASSPLVEFLNREEECVQPGPEEQSANGNISRAAQTGTLDTLANGMEGGIQLRPEGDLTNRLPMLRRSTRIKTQKKDSIKLTKRSNTQLTRNLPPKKMSGQKKEVLPFKLAEQDSQVLEINEEVLN